VTTPSRELLRQKLDDPEVVSPEQRAAVEKVGDFLLVACPGSGKTRTAGLCAAWWGLDEPPRSIAVTSYTNVAVDEIRASAAEVGLVLGEPHFCGTLHSLLLRFVFYPFGHLVMGCDGTPRVAPDGQAPPVEINDVWLGDNRYWAKVSDFHFRPDGSFDAQNPQSLPLTIDDIVAVGSDQAHKLKAQLFAEGYASFSDSMYISMGVLAEHESIRRRVAGRFDEVIVDEVQDTSSVQFECLSLLRSTGKLGSLVLIGDPDQAIYEWQGADPVACRAFASDHGLGTLELTRNYRSSQAICNVTHRLSARGTPENAVGAAKEFGVPPEVLVYDSSDMSAAIDSFKSRLDTHGVEIQATVLVRNRTLARKLNNIGNVSMSWQVRALGDAAATFHALHSFESRSLKGVEDVLHRLAWGSIGRLDPAARVKLRDTACRLIAGLPEPTADKSFKDWIRDVRSHVAAAVAELSDEPEGKVSSAIRARAGDDMRIASDVLPTTVAVAVARTVHSAKGESHEAVLLLSGKATAKRDSARDWIKGELGEARDEETRIGYVALTRARRYCAVALPDTTPTDILSAYEAAGFVIVSAA
jgi:DNA helicase II / ATP-dependent DNA helicase PcrA